MNSYSLTARLYPALLALLPLSAAIVIFFDSSQWYKSAVSLVAAAGGHIVLMRVARNRGDRRQADWWSSIGGNPTALKLRWSRAEHDDDHAELHERVSAFTGMALPTRLEEAADPQAAIRVYSRAVARLRELTRNHEAFPRVWDELKNYGFARNTYGVKPIAVCISFCGLTVTLVLLVLRMQMVVEIPYWKLLAVGIADLAAMLFWIFGVNFSLMERDSNRYASALLDAATDVKARGGQLFV